MDHQRLFFTFGGAYRYKPNWLTEIKTRMTNRATTDKESELVSLLKLRSDEAFAVLYDNFAALLFGVIVRIVDDRKEAEDLLQDCFVKIWRYAAEYDPEKGRLATWLINIARNTAFDFTRSKYFTQKRKNQSLGNLVPTTLVYTALEVQVETSDLRQVLKKLTPVYRQVIEWMYFEGYTQQEIAEKFNIPLGTVKSRARLALKELREFYY